MNQVIKIYNRNIFHTTCYLKEPRLSWSELRSDQPVVKSMVALIVVLYKECDCPVNTPDQDGWLIINQSISASSIHTVSIKSKWISLGDWKPSVVTAYSSVCLFMALSERYGGMDWLVENSRQCYTDMPQPLRVEICVYSRQPIILALSNEYFDITIEQIRTNFCCQYPFSTDPFRNCLLVV